MLRAILAPLALLAVLAGGAACAEKEAGEIVRYPSGKRPAAPEIKGDLLEGGTYELATKRDKVVVVNFWGSWCAPCRVEADDLEAVHKELPEVEFLGINVRDDRDKAIAYARDKNSYPSIFDPGSRTALKFEQVPPNTIPATIIIDRQGKIAFVVRKALLEEDLRAMVGEVLAEKSGSAAGAAAVSPREPASSLGILKARSVLSRSLSPDAGARRRCPAS